jgi:hypothetical protein
VFAEMRHGLFLLLLRMREGRAVEVDKLQLLAANCR